MDVKIKDREKVINQTRMALNMVGVAVDYKTTKLILQTLDKVNKLQGEFTVRDASLIESNWGEWMNNYASDQNREEL